MLSPRLSFITALFFFFFGFFIGNGGIVKSDLIQTFISLYENTNQILNFVILPLKDLSSFLSITENSQVPFQNGKHFLNFVNEFSSFTLFGIFLLLESCNLLFIRKIKNKKSKANSPATIFRKGLIGGDGQTKRVQEFEASRTTRILLGIYRPPLLMPFNFQGRKESQTQEKFRSELKAQISLQEKKKLCC